MFSCSGDFTIKCWDANTFERLAELTGHTNFVRSVCLSANLKHTCHHPDTQRRHAYTHACMRARLQGHKITYADNMQACVLLHAMSWLPTHTCIHEYMPAHTHMRMVCAAPNSSGYSKGVDGCISDESAITNLPTNLSQDLTCW